MIEMLGRLSKGFRTALLGIAVVSLSAGVVGCGERAALDDMPDDSLWIPLLTHRTLLL